MAALDAFVAAAGQRDASSSAARTSSSSTSRTKSRAQFLQLSLTLTSGINLPARGVLRRSAVPRDAFPGFVVMHVSAKLIFHCCLRELAASRFS